MFPESWHLPLDRSINDFVDWLVVTHGDSFEAAANALLAVLVWLERGLRGAPWWLVIAIITGLMLLGSRRVAISLAVGAALIFIGLLGMWDLAMQTLALMIVATVLAILIGVPIGILLAQSDRLRAATLPVLDAMQTMPAFVYLIPALLLFGLGKVPAIFATVIYATPPLIRLTELGIRLVDADVKEAVAAFGASRWQRLRMVELPLALPTILAGVNQTTMLALSMVVIGSMIGARGLGEEVLLGIQRLDVGRGMVAGLAIVALAVVLDRLTQAIGGRLSVTGRTTRTDGTDR